MSDLKPQSEGEKKERRPMEYIDRGESVDVFSGKSRAYQYVEEGATYESLKYPIFDIAGVGMPGKRR
jgi:hypothetical protein